MASDDPAESSFAKVGVVFYLEDLKEVSGQTDDRIKYVVQHKVSFVYTRPAPSRGKHRAGGTCPHAQPGCATPVGRLQLNTARRSSTHILLSFGPSILLPPLLLRAERKSRSRERRLFPKLTR